MVDLHLPPHPHPEEAHLHPHPEAAHLHLHLSSLSALHPLLPHLPPHPPNRCHSQSNLRVLPAGRTPTLLPRLLESSQGDLHPLLLPATCWIVVDHLSLLRGTYWTEVDHP